MAKTSVETREVISLVCLPSDDGGRWTLIGEVLARKIEWWSRNREHDFCYDLIQNNWDGGRIRWSWMSTGFRRGVGNDYSWIRRHMLELKSHYLDVRKYTWSLSNKEGAFAMFRYRESTRRTILAMVHVENRKKVAMLIRMDHKGTLERKDNVYQLKSLNGLTNRESASCWDKTEGRKEECKVRDGWRLK